MIEITVRDRLDIKESLKHLLCTTNSRKGLTKKNSVNSIYSENYSFGDTTLTYYSPAAAKTNIDWHRYHKGQEKWIGTIEYKPADTKYHFVANSLHELRFDMLRFLKNRHDLVKIVANYDNEPHPPCVDLNTTNSTAPVARPGKESIMNEALKKIEEAKATGAAVLDLSGMNLRELPAEIGQLTKLKALFLYGNRLTSVPAEIRQLTKLTRLNLSDNQIDSLPPEIGQLTNLTRLDASWNCLDSLPSEIGQLTKLTDLNLFINQIDSVPAEIGQLTKLTRLNLSDNRLTSVPSVIGKLTKLTTLDLSENRLTSVPAEIRQLTKLTTLDLTWNLITELPSEIMDKMEKQGTLIYI